MTRGSLYDARPIPPEHRGGPVAIIEQHTPQIWRPVDGCHLGMHSVTGGCVGLRRGGRDRRAMVFRAARSQCADTVLDKTPEATRVNGSRDSCAARSWRGCAQVGHSHSPRVRSCQFHSEGRGNDLEEPR